jgi:archaellum component FlaF (FlaF/FlaG flagellin family)
MGMSVAASSAIIFTGFLLAATGLIVAIDSTVMDIQQELSQSLDRQGETTQTSLHFDNATKNLTRIFINVTNTGSNLLKVSGIQVLVNGTLMTGKIVKHTVSGSATTDIWAPAERLYIELNTMGLSGQRVSVIASNGKASTGVLA